MSAQSNPTRPSAIVTIALAIAVCISAAGCGAFEEIDKASALMDIGKEGKQGETAKAAKEEARTRGLEWTNVTSLNTGEVDDRIARCTLGGSVTFTHKDDCLAQGGTPADF